MSSRQVRIESVEFGAETLPIIAGPCVIESRDHVLMMAESIQKIAGKLEIPFIFKASFDKANRTAGTAFRGPGIDQGLQIMAEVKSQFNVPVIIDIHLPEQAALVAEVADAIQIPAFLCRQTDLLVAAAETGRPVNIKKGQFLAPSDMSNAVGKIEQTGSNQILITERGVQFGYNNLVTDLRSIPIMQATGYPVLFDATHSAQLPGGLGSATAGLRQYIPHVARGAVAAGCDGIFLEVHDNPSAALSDAATQWPLNQLERFLTELKQLRSVVCQFDAKEQVE